MTRLPTVSDERDRSKACALLARLGRPRDHADDATLLLVLMLLEIAGEPLPYGLEARVSPWREALARNRAGVLLDLGAVTEADVDREKACSARNVFPSDACDAEDDGDDEDAG